MQYLVIVQSHKSKRKLISRYSHLIYNTLYKHRPSIKMLNNVFLPIATPTIYGHHHCCCYWNPPEECNDDYSHCFHHTQHQLFHHRKAAFELPYSFWSIKSFCLQPSNISPLSGQGQMLETSFLSFCSIFCFYITKQKENSVLRGKENSKFMQVIRELAYLIVLLTNQQRING